MSYEFESPYYFHDSYGLYATDLKNNGFDLSEVLIYRSNANGRYNFVKDFTQTPLARKSDLYGIPQKHEVLKALADDLDYETNMAPELIASISRKSRNLTQDMTSSEALSTLYAWLLENVEYETDFYEP